MEMTPQGLNKLSKLEADKLVSYQDDAGVWTIGRGWTGFVHGRKLGPGVRITQAESDELFRNGLKPYEAQVNALIKFPVPQRVYEAQVMLAWNIGWAGWKSSSAARFFSNTSTWNAQSIAQLGELMKRYNKIKKKGKLVVSNGLKNRRAQEVAWMLGANTSPMPVKQKVAAAVGVVSTTTVAADQTGIDSGTLQSVVDSAGIFGMTGSTTLACIGSILLIGVVGYIAYSKLAGKDHKAEVAGVE